jgi:hypothetical protein
MNGPGALGTDSAIETARRFLAFLDACRWSDAAALVHPDTAEQFRAQQLELLRLQSTGPGRAEGGETLFQSPASLFGSAEQASLQPATALLARFAEALDPASFLAAAAPGDAGRAPHVKRTLLSCTESPDGSASAQFRVEWGRGPSDAIRTLALGRTPDGWRIRDAELAPLGNTGLVLPDADFAALRAVFAEDGGI